MIRRTPLDGQKSMVIALTNTYSCSVSGNVTLLYMRTIEGLISICSAFLYKEFAFYFQSTAHCMATIKTRYKTARTIKPTKI